MDAGAGPDVPGDEPPLPDLPAGSALDAFLEALHIAIRLEEEGLQFYTLNANRVRNPRGRAAFHLLMREAHEHLTRLRAQLESLVAAVQGTPDEARAAAAPDRALTANPIFSPGRPLAERDADEREVIRQAIAIEWEAHGYYRERSAGSSDPWSRLIYDDLALDERDRYLGLVAVYEAMIGK